jgi:hypothetical protein
MQKDEKQTSQRRSIHYDNQSTNNPLDYGICIFPDSSRTRPGLRVATLCDSPNYKAVISNLDSVGGVKNLTVSFGTRQDRISLI